MQTIVKVFGENETEQWYINPLGEKVICSEYEINNLWLQWVSAKGSERADENGYTIFVNNETPLYLEKETPITNPKIPNPETFGNMWRKGNITPEFLTAWVNDILSYYK